MAFLSDPQMCLEHCRSVGDCRFFTHYSFDEACLVYSDCVAFDTIGCTDCISSESSCPDLVCDTPGNNK